MSSVPLLGISRMETRGRSSLKRACVSQDQQTSSDVDITGIGTSLTGGLEEDLRQPPPKPASALIPQQELAAPLGDPKLHSSSPDVGGGSPQQAPSADTILQNLRGHRGSTGPSAAGHAPVRRAEGGQRGVPLPLCVPSHQYWEIKQVAPAGFHVSSQCMRECWMDDKASGDRGGHLLRWHCHLSCCMRYEHTLSPPASLCSCLLSWPPCLCR